MKGAQDSSSLLEPLCRHCLNLGVRAGDQPWLCCRPARHLPTIPESHSSPGAGKTGFSSYAAALSSLPGQPGTAPWVHHPLTFPSHSATPRTESTLGGEQHRSSTCKWRTALGDILVPISGQQPQSDPCALAAVTAFFFHLHVPQLVRLRSSCRVRLFVLFAVK